MESLSEMRPSVLAFSTSFFMMAEVIQLVAEFAFPLVMVFLVVRCFTRIYRSVPRGCAREEKDAAIGNGGGSGEEELVNSKNPTSPLYTFSMKEHGLRRGERSGSGSPLTDRKTLNYRTTHEMVHAQIEVMYGHI
jgi:hypothetical protein